VLPEPGLAIRIRRATRRSIAALTNAMEEPLATARRARDHLRTALSQRMTTGFRVESEARSWQRAGVIWLLIGSSLLAALIIPA
jgi:hypothetical protein